ncbi:MAG: hypothetical protein Q9216_002979 [Gyalolechia sp. 2 TL-2023]
MQTIIDETGDLVVEVTQKYSDGTSRMATFKVNRGILKKASQVLLTMLVSPHWTGGPQTTVSLGEGHIRVTEVWLRVVHNVKLTYTLQFPELWQLVEAIDYYALDITAFNPWFANWYAQQPVPPKPAELLFPAWRFDHARAFAKCTRDLAYDHIGHIMEKNPSMLHQYHLPSRLIPEQLNAAKGRLRTVLFRGLWDPCNSLLRASCACRKETLYDYQHHLYSIEVWPLETIFLNTSIHGILERLDDFSYEPRTGACSQCRQNYTGIVARVVSRVEEYFDGLCLDCLDRSKPKTGDIDLDYWRHDKLKEWEWVQGCRFPHRQSTWFFSFNGRKEERDRLVKKRKESDRTHPNYLHRFGTGSDSDGY